MSHRVPLRATVWLTLMLGASCLGGAPEAPEFFTLGAAGGAPADPPVAARPDLGLVVGPIQYPRYLDRPEIVTRDGSHRLLVWSQHRWGGSLRGEILRAVATDLSRLLGTERVVVYPDAPRFRVDYRVLLELDRFDGVLGESITLQGRWTVASAREGTAVVVEETHIEQAVASASWEDLVSAHRTALGRVNRAIAARIADLPAEHGATRSPKNPPKWGTPIARAP